MISETTRRTAIWTIALCVCSLTYTGCTRKSSGSASPITTATYWKVWGTVPNEPERGPAPLFLNLESAVLSGPDLTGTRTGSTFQFVVTANGSSAAVDGVLESSTTARGNFTTTKANGSTVSGTFRMEAFAPTGDFTIDGAVLGTSITHTTRTAIGVRDFEDRALSNLNEVEVITGSPALDLEMDFEPGNLAVGDLAVGTGPGDVGIVIEFSTGTAAGRPIATGGSLNVTKFDNTGFTAAFTLNLNTGDTVTGSFDVRFDLNAFDPPDNSTLNVFFAGS